MKITLEKTCDNCGKPIQDIDEILCRECKISLAIIPNIKKELQECIKEINKYYWIFTRCANAKPPFMVCPEAFKKRAELEELLKQKMNK